MDQLQKHLPDKCKARDKSIKASAAINENRRTNGRNGKDTVKDYAESVMELPSE